MSELEINSDVECDNCICCSAVRLPQGNLFSKTKRPSAGPLANRLQGDVINIIANKYAITVNVLPFKKMNRKLWYTYSHDKQREILGRIEAKFRRDTPSVKLLELHYELCPSEDKFHNIHFHALYEMPEEFVAELETYYKRVCFDSSNKNWRYLDIRPIFDLSGWLKYITKDMKEIDVNKLAD